MIEELREEEIIKKDRRAVQAFDADPETSGADQRRRRPLVDTKTDNKMQIVINEIMQDKIYLDTEMNVQVAAPAGRSRGR